MDKESVEQIYTENYNAMMATAYARTGSTQDAEDAIQSAAVRLLRATGRDYPSKLLAYLVTNSAALRIIDNRCQHECLDSQPPYTYRTSPSAERVAMGRIELEKTLERAPWEVRMFAAGYSLLELSDISGLNIQTIHSRIRTWRLKNRDDR